MGRTLREDTDTQREDGHVMMEAEMKRCIHKSRHAKDGW